MGRHQCDLVTRRSHPPYSFKFVNAVGISKVIQGLSNTAALGRDGIPVSIYKKGAEILASPIAHLGKQISD